MLRARVELVVGAVDVPEIPGRSRLDQLAAAGAANDAGLDLPSDRPSPKLVKVTIRIEACRKIAHLQANLAMLPDAS
jgi:hypothetical protein